jgi:transposase
LPGARLRRLVYLPPYSPELQPAETLWELIDAPIRSFFAKETLKYAA